MRVVTCGVYGWFFHTRFLGSEAEAEDPAMFEGMAAILNRISYVHDLQAYTQMSVVSEAIEQFVSRFP